MTKQEAEEKFEQTIFDGEVKVPESEYVGLEHQDSKLQVDGYFTLEQLELIVKAYKEYLADIM